MSYTVFHKDNFNALFDKCSVEYEVTYPAIFNKFTLTECFTNKKAAVEFLQDKWEEFEEWYHDEWAQARIEEGYYTLDFYANCCNIRRVEYVGFVCKDWYLPNWEKC